VRRFYERESRPIDFISEGLIKQAAIEAFSARQDCKINHSLESSIDDNADDATARHSRGENVRMFYRNCEQSLNHFIRIDTKLAGPFDFVV